MNVISSYINLDENYYVVNGLNGTPTIRKGKFIFYPNKSYVKFIEEGKKDSDSFDSADTFDDMQIDCIFSGTYDDYGRRIFKLVEKSEANNYLIKSCKEQIKEYEDEIKENQKTIDTNKKTIELLSSIKYLSEKL